MRNQARNEFNIARFLILSASITILALTFGKSGDIRFHFKTPKIGQLGSDIESLVAPVIPGIPRDLPSYDFLLGIVYGVKSLSTNPVQIVDPLPNENSDTPYLPWAEERLDPGPFQEQKTLPTEVVPPDTLPSPSGLRIVQPPSLRIVQ